MKGALEHNADLESRSSKLSSDLMECHRREQSHELKCIDLKEEIKVLELQLDEIHGKIQGHKDAEAEARSETLKGNARIDELEHELNSAMDQLQQAQSNATIVSHVGDKLASDLMIYLESIGSRDLLSSPIPSSGDRPNSGDEADSNIAAAGLTNLSIFIEELKSKADYFSRQTMALSEAAENEKAEMNEFRRRYDSLENNNCAMLLDLERYRTELEVRDDEIEKLQNLRAESTKDLRSLDQLIDSIERALTTMRFSCESIETRFLTVLTQSGISNSIVVGTTFAAADQQDCTHRTPGEECMSRINAFMTGFHGFTERLEDALGLVGKEVEAKQADASTKQYAYDRLKAITTEKEQALLVERDDQVEKINSLQIAVEVAEQELARLKLTTNELHRNNADLEFEFKNASESNLELRNALTEAESFIVELRARNKSLQGVEDTKSREIESLQSRIEATQKKASYAEVELEKAISTINRLRTENSSLENARMTLDVELERTRAELKEYLANPINSPESPQLSFELEKLLAGIGSTLDQFHSTIDATSTVKHYKGEGGGPPGQEVNISARVEFVLKRLGDLRSWTREETRSKRMLESRCAELEKDVSSLQLKYSETSNSLKAELRQVLEREAVLRERVETYNSPKKALEIQRKTEENERLAMTVQQLQTQIEDARGASLRMNSELQAKTYELDRVKEKLSVKENEAARYQERASQATDKLDSISSELASTRDEMRVLRSSQARYNDNTERLEASLDKAKSECALYEKKAQGLELELAQVSKFKSQVEDLESALARSTETARSYHEAKLVALENIVSIEHALEAAQRKCVVLEKEKADLEAEKDSLDHELGTLRESLEETKALIEKEKAERERFQITSSSVRRVQEESRIQIENKTALLERAEQKLASYEGDSRSLRESANQLRRALAEKEQALTKEADLRVRAEHEITSLKASLDRAQREISSSATRAANLRSDGRKAHMAIVDCVGLVKSLANIIEVDSAMLSVGHEGSRPESHANTGGGSTSQAVTDEADTFSLREIRTAIELLGSITLWAQSVSRDRLELEGSVRKIENEKNRLLREMQSLDTLHEARVARIKADNKTAEDQLAEYRSKYGDVNKSLPVVNTDIFDRETQNKISMLEAQLVYERGERDRANNEVATLRKAADDSRRRKVDVNSYSREIEGLKRELKSAQAEVQAVQHHRAVLRDSIEKLERELLSRSEEIADLKGSVVAGHFEESGTDIDGGLRRQNQRYRSRASALEDLVTIYRSAMIALFPDGSSYGAQQFLSPTSGFAVPLPDDTGGLEIRNSNWVEQELSTIRRGYAEEIRLLEGEVTELRTKLKQSNSYTSELKKRFEENLKAMYRCFLFSVTTVLSIFRDVMSIILTFIFVTISPVFFFS